MLAVIARLKVFEDKTEDFVAIMTELAEKVKSEEKGCLQYQLCRARDTNSFVVIERYADKEALLAHSATPYFNEAMNKLKACVAVKPETEVFTVMT
jgi:quinol monooxygenase YgiN